MEGPAEEIRKAASREKEPLKNFYKAEDYHQDYLVKNPDGYCHIRKELIEYVWGL